MTNPPMKTDPLGPVDTVLTALTALALGFCLLMVVTAVSSDSILSINDPSPSVTATVSGLEISGGDEEIVHGLRDNASSFPGTVHITSNDPSTVQRLGVVLPEISAVVWLVGLLALGRAAVRQARRAGPFASAVAARTRLVAWWLLLAAPLDSLAASFGTAVFLDGAITDGVNLTQVTLSNLDFPWSAVIAGAVVLTFSRLLRQAGDLQDEVDLTV